MSGLEKIHVKDLASHGHWCSNIVLFNCTLHMWGREVGG